jgi:hypothetical protein
MNMIKEISLAWTLASMMVFSSIAIADDAPATYTYEVSIKSLRLPVSPNGTVSLRECDDCDYHSIRVTPNTQYMINGEQLRLTKFRKAILDLKLRMDITVNVTRDEATSTVASVYVYVQ